MNPAEEIKAIARDLQEHILWYQSEGVDTWVKPTPKIVQSAVTQPDGAHKAQSSGRLSTLNTLESVRELLGDCQRCTLSTERTHIVFGDGNPKADLLFVGEAPGQDEDIQGKPFVGKSGQLLSKMISAMGLSRDQVYIANIIKCRPPKNRNPKPDEIAACSPFLDQQIAAISPKVICALGSFAAQTLLKTDTKISALRGRFHDLNGLKILPTFHPAYLLHNPGQKRTVWEDLQKVMAVMGLTVKGTI
jgi:uracil-DNA glycosylase